MAYGVIIGQTSTGLTIEQADARYLQLSGGTITGPVTMNNVFKVYDGYIDAIQITSTEGNLILGASSVVTLAPTAKTINVSNSRIINVATPTSNNDAANKQYVDSKSVLVNDKPITETSTYQYWLSTSPSNKTTITIPKGGMYSFRMSSGMGDARVNIDKISEGSPLFTVIVRGEVDYHVSTTAWTDSTTPSLVGSQYVIIDS